MDKFSALHMTEWVYLLQSSPQIEKHMLLRELTEDTHQGRSKGKVLNELAACIAAGLSWHISSHCPKLKLFYCTDW